MPNRLSPHRWAKAAYDLAGSIAILDLGLGIVECWHFVELVEQMDRVDALTAPLHCVSAPQQPRCAESNVGSTAQKGFALGTRPHPTACFSNAENQTAVSLRYMGFAHTQQPHHLSASNLVI
jgi:hypothetical protein